MIEAVKLRKTFGSLVAVNEISLTIPQGETFGLLGPNGAGKSTTIHLLTGALKPDSGTVTLDGLADPTRPQTRKKVGIAPQSDSLYDELTGEENLRLFGRLYGLSRSTLKERVAKVLSFVGLEERKQDRLGTYSGGMKQRLNLACALIHDPMIIFLDEPTAGVDPQSRAYLLDNIEQLASEGRTIVYTTHYMEEAERLCDRVAIIDHGKILALDTVEALRNQYGGHSRVQAELLDLPTDLTGFPGKIEQNTWSFESLNPFEEALHWQKKGVRFRNFRVEPPSLETVFLNLTGRGLRDS